MIKDELFYEKLRNQLYQTSNWPSSYLYKFIITTDESESQKLIKLFDSRGAIIKTKFSKNGKYTSISVQLKMKNPDEVISYYKLVGEQIKGVISL